jgi:diguanylate cyclase (GGDEF)-like protein/PAS domain S-box-containing protein
MSGQCAVGADDDLQARLREAEQRLALLARMFQYAREGIVVTDVAGLIVDVNPGFCKITGYVRDEVIGLTPRILRSGRHDGEFYSAMWREISSKGYWQGEILNRRKSGDVYPELLSISRIDDAAGIPTHYVAIFTDITEIKDASAQIEYLAYHDALTQLPNRSLFSDRLAVAMAQARRSGGLLGVAYLDLDGFKPVNDLYGHECGDRVLIEISGRLQQAVRGGDSVARFGGDEFVLLLNKLSSQAECENILGRLLRDLAKPLTLDGREVRVTASVGVTLFPDDDADADTLLRHADHALYLAKEDGRNRCHVFDAAHDQEMRSRLDRRRCVEAALANDELRLHYQPKVDMRLGRAIGVEALIRWLHPENGLLPPASFLQFIENTPAEILLGEWVIGEAVRQCCAWRAAGLELPVSVNVSAFHLAQDNFAARLGEILADSPGFPPGYLEIEILETAAFSNIGQTTSLMDACRALGVGFVLDDFGTGYSSLTYLKRLPVDTLKVDQSFVRDMLEDDDDLAIVEGVIGLARAFRHDVIAEGVETASHGARLLQLGCHFAQGYGIARPMPADAVPDWVAAWRPEREFLS